MKLHKIFAAGVLLASGLAASAKGTEAEMNAFINDLMGKMTLQEKLGQLNLPASDDIVTGEAKIPISERW